MKRGTTWQTVLDLGLVMKDVVESTSYGTAALKIRKKLFVRLKEDGESIVVILGFDEREIVMNANSQAFYITDHYRDYPAMLVHLSRVSKTELSDILNLSHRFVTTKRAR